MIDLHALKNRIMMLVSRGVIESTNDSTGIQNVKGSFLAGENRDKMERFQNFGFSSNPPARSEMVAVFVGGNRDHPLIVAVDDRASRIKGLATGESVMYNQSGDKIHIKAGGDVDVSHSGSMNITTGGDIKAEATNVELTLDKFKVENDTAELIDVLARMALLLSVEPLIVNKGAFAAIKAELESFKA